MSCQPKSTAFLAMSCALLISACGEKVSGVSEEDVRISNLKILQGSANSLIGKPRLVKPEEPDYVPEPVAQSLRSQLAKWPKGRELADMLARCSGQLVSERLGDKSACYNEYDNEADEACLKKHGYGLESLGQAVTADRFDLNGDGIKDYIISDRYYCRDFSNNQTNAYFVMLSDSKKGFKPAHGDWASYGLQVLDDKVNGKLVLVEQAPKTYGLYTTIYQLADSKFVRKSCVLHDKDGYSSCDMPAPQS